MDPSQLLSILLAQHRALRALLDEIEHAAVGRKMFQLKGVLISLRTALEKHNAAEEAALAPLLPDADAWGAVRVEAMRAEHAAEHGLLYRVVDAALAARDDDAVSRAAAVVGDLRAHMDAEEKSFLSDRVLRDDAVSIDPMGG